MWWYKVFKASVWRFPYSHIPMTGYKERDKIVKEKRRQQLQHEKGRPASMKFFRTSRTCWRIASVIKVVIGSSSLLFPIFSGVQLIYPGPEISWIPSKSNIKMLHPKQKTNNLKSVIASGMSIYAESIKQNVLSASYHTRRGKKNSNSDTIAGKSFLNLRLARENRTVLITFKTLWSKITFTPEVCPEKKLGKILLHTNQN